MLRAHASLILDPPTDDAWFDLALMRKDIELALAAHVAAIGGLSVSPVSA